MTNWSIKKVVLTLEGRCEDEKYSYRASVDFGNNCYEKEREGKGEEREKRMLKRIKSYNKTKIKKKIKINGRYKRGFWLSFELFHLHVEKK